MLSGWAIHHIPQHIVPLSSGPAQLIAIHMAALGALRLGAGLLAQQHLGLRPSEMLFLERRDISFPSGNEVTMVSAVTVIGLGVRTGTMAKRAQCVVLRGPMVTISLLGRVLVCRTRTVFFRSLMITVGVC